MRGQLTLPARLRLRRKRDFDAAYARGRRLGNGFFTVTATANDLGAPVPEEIKEQRWHRLMAHQQAISQRRLKRRIGNREQIIIDEVGPGSAKGLSKGRSKGDAPQIDGSVFVHSRRPLRVGEIASVKIERADAYDLHGTAVGY